MERYLTDTNFWLRYLLEDIKAQFDWVLDYVNQAKRGNIRLKVPVLTIAEINFILRKQYQKEKEEVVRSLEILVSQPFLEIENCLVVFEAIKLYKDNNVSLVDCYLAAQARHDGAELLTFDKRLKKLAEGK